MVTTIGLKLVLLDLFDAFDINDHDNLFCFLKNMRSTYLSMLSLLIVKRIN